MNIYIVLLRGINVGGKHKLPMVELCELLTSLGYKNIQTYIQSGNVVLKSSEKDKVSIQIKIQQAILERYGYIIPVLVKTKSELNDIFNKSPFKDEILKASYFTLLHNEPSSEIMQTLWELIIPDEEFLISDDCVYFYSPKGYGKAKANNNFFERKLKVTATTRNYNTMLKLLTLAT